MSTNVGLEVTGCQRLMPDGRIRWQVWTWHGPKNTFGQTGKIEREGYALSHYEAAMKIAAEMVNVWEEITADHERTRLNELMGNQR